MDKYELLKEQIKKELDWAIKASNDEIDKPGITKFNRGMVFAYESIMRTIENLDEEESKA